MNLENIDVLSQKVEKVLETLRRVKAEKNQLQAELRQVKEQALEEREQAAAEQAKAVADLDARDRELANARVQIADKVKEIESLTEVNRTQNEEIQNAQNRFRDLLKTIEAELGTEIPVAPTATPAPEAPAEAPAAETTAAPVVTEEPAQKDFFV